MVNLEIGFAMIKVLFFAHLRDLAGLDQIELPLDDMVYVKDLLGQFELHLPRELIDALSDESAMVSVNHKYAEWGDLLPDGAEVGILPPVSGG